PVDIDALVDARMVVNQQIRRCLRLGSAEPSRGHLLFDRSLDVVLKEWILVEPRVSGWQTVGRTPVVSVKACEVKTALDVRAHVHGRRAACDGECQECGSG